jgi:hypothetical protein
VKGRRERENNERGKSSKFGAYYYSINLSSNIAVFTEILNVLKLAILDEICS